MFVLSIYVDTLAMRPKSDDLNRQGLRRTRVAELPVNDVPLSPIISPIFR